MKKNIVFISITIILALACSQQSTKELPSDAVTANKKEPLDTFITRFFEVFNSHDWQRSADFYADSALFLDPSFGTEYVKLSHEQIIKNHQQLVGYFPDLHDSLTGIYPSGNKVITEFTATGTSKDGKKLKLPLCDIFTVENGKITKDATYYDNKH